MGWYEKVTFRPFWGVWYFCAAADLFGQFVWGTWNALLAGLSLLGLFLVVESWAAWRKSKDDTLSEFSAWLSGLVNVHPGSMFHQRLASVLAAFLGIFTGWVLSWGFRSVPLDVAGAVVAVGIWIWLRDHFQWLVAKGGS